MKEERLFNIAPYRDPLTRSALVKPSWLTIELLVIPLPPIPLQTCNPSLALASAAVWIMAKPAALTPSPRRARL